jgi:hypothetical protein
MFFERVVFQFWQLVVEALRLLGREASSTFRLYKCSVGEMIRREDE